MTDQPTFAQRIAEALQARKTAQSPGPRSLSDLAAALGMDKGNLHRTVNGVRPMPPQLAARIAELLPEVGE